MRSMHHSNYDFLSKLGNWDFPISIKLDSLTIFSEYFQIFTNFVTDWIIAASSISNLVGRLCFENNISMKSTDGLNLEIY